MARNTGERLLDVKTYMKKMKLKRSHSYTKPPKPIEKTKRGYFDYNRSSY